MPPTNAEHYAVAERLLQRAFDESLATSERAWAAYDVKQCMEALMVRVTPPLSGVALAALVKRVAPVPGKG
jgi:hypothetical protein